MPKLVSSLLASLVMAVSCSNEGVDHGHLEPLVRANRNRLATAPCDAVAVQNLAQVLRDGNDVPAALTVFRTYASTCADPADGVAMVHLALEREHGDNASAIVVARRRLKTAPKDEDRALVLGTLLEKSGEAAAVTEAVGLYREVVAANPRSKEGLAALAKGLEAAGDACGALVTWPMVWRFDRDQRGAADTAMARLALLPDCHDHNVVGDVKFKHTLVNGSLFAFPVKVNGQAASFGYDNATVFSYMSDATAKTMTGLKPLGQRLSFRTAYGTLEGDLVRAELVDWGGVSIRSVDFVVVPRLEGDVMGMLGVNVLARVKLTQVTDKEWTLTGR